MEPAWTDEEFERLVLAAHAGDENARNELIENNLRLVWSVVQRFLGRGIEAEDLFQIGSVGLVRAVDRFDPAFGVKFSTYAVPLIIGEIRRFFRDDGPVKVSRSLKENALRVRKAQELLAAKLGRDPSMHEIAEEIGISIEDLVTATDAMRPLSSLQETLTQDDGSALRLEDRLPDSRVDESAWVDRLAIQGALGQLADVERQVIFSRFFHDKTQVQTAEILGISQVQVCRIEKRALLKVRQYMQH